LLRVVRPFRTRRSAHRTSDEGFTLLEVLIAIGLVAVAITSLAHLFALAVRANLASRDVTYGAVLASQKIERIRSADFPDDVPAQGEDALDIHGLPVDAGVTAPVYRRRWTIEPLPAHPVQAVVVTVEVSAAADANRAAVRVTSVRARRQ
jgi:prepilin-type N-terminal cleavage/methylation domain-containing protein